MQLHRPYMMVARAPAQSIIADCTEGEIYDEIAFLATKARCAWGKWTDSDRDGLGDERAISNVRKCAFTRAWSMYTATG